MADTEETPGEEDTPSTDTVETPRDPVKGLKKANRTLSKERDDLKAELEKARKEAADAKLSETEKARADIDRLTKERDAAAADRDKARADREQERQISQLVAKHGLRDPDFGSLILGKFNADEHEDLDTFAKEIKKQEKWKPLFGVPGEDSPRITDEDGEEIVPRTPRSAAPRGNTKATGITPEQEEFARKKWPGDKAKQDAYLDNVRSISRGVK